VQDAH